MVSKLALVTGASSGIGNAFAKRLAADGYDLVVVGRRLDRLEELAASLPERRVRVLVADLATDDGVDAVADVYATEPQSLLVNNAGVAHYTPLAQLPADKARELVHVKVVAPTMLTRATVPGMQARGEGRIINVAGMLAFSGPAPPSSMAKRAVYAGTLAHLVAMSQTLSAELEGTGITVQVLCPGVVATEFHERQGLDLIAVASLGAGLGRRPRLDRSGHRHPHRGPRAHHHRPRDSPAGSRRCRGALDGFRVVRRRSGDGGRIRAHRRGGGALDPQGPTYQWSASRRVRRRGDSNGVPRLKASPTQGRCAPAPASRLECPAARASFGSRGTPSPLPGVRVGARCPLWGPSLPGLRSGS